ncbi:MAG: alpha/beta hydrolase [Acidimicrobiia bacterium]
MGRSPVYYLTLLVLFLAALKVMVWFLEPHMAFVPFRGQDVTPERYGITFSEFTAETTDRESIVGWVLEQADARTEVLFFHGNGGNLSLWSDVLAGIHAKGYAVVALDYRGYGNSTGSPSERGLYLDTDAFVHHFWQNLHRPERNVVYWGRSLGATMAAYATTLTKPDGLILESPFPSARSLLTHYPVLKVLSLFSSYRFPTEEFLRSFDRPVLIIHGDADRIVPYRQGQDLFARLQTKKEFVTLRGADHNDLQGPDAVSYWAPVGRFVTSIQKK